MDCHIADEHVASLDYPKPTRVDRSFATRFYPDTCRPTRPRRVDASLRDFSRSITPRAGRAHPDVFWRRNAAGATGLGESDCEPGGGEPRHPCLSGELGHRHVWFRSPPMEKAHRAG